MPTFEKNEHESDPGTVLNWTDILMGEALICGLLSKALYIYPDKAWLQSLIDGDVFAEAPFGSGQADIDAGLALLQGWSAENTDQLSQAAFDAVEADYMHLFVGPGKLLAPPWESVYSNRERVLFQKETLQVRNWYRRFDLQIEHLYNQPDDHIGIEFSFLAHLAQLSLQAFEAGDQPRFEKVLNAQREFIRTHLSRWVPRWSADVVANARTPFFTGLAQVAIGVLKELQTELELPAAEKVIQ